MWDGITGSFVFGGRVQPLRARSIDVVRFYRTRVRLARGFRMADVTITVSKHHASMLRNTLRALRHRNFRLFIEGQMCSLIGYWMQNIAQSWLLYRLTESTTLLGMLAFAGSVPILLLAPLAGLWSDRANLHRLMFTIQVLEMVQAAALAALAVSGAIEPWHIVALSMLLGMLVAIELPVRHAYLLELVGDKARVSVQLPVRLSRRSEPQPDLGRPRHHRGQRALLARAAPAARRHRGPLEAPCTANSMSSASRPCSPT